MRHSSTFEPTLSDYYFKWRVSRVGAAVRRDVGLWHRYIENTVRGNRAMCVVFEMEAARPSNDLERKERCMYLKHFLDPEDACIKGTFAAYSILRVPHLDLSRFSESKLRTFENQLNHILWFMSLGEKTPDADRIIAEVQKARDWVAAYAA